MRLVRGYGVEDGATRPRRRRRRRGRRRRGRRALLLRPSPKRLAQTGSSSCCCRRRSTSCCRRSSGSRGRSAGSAMRRPVARGRVRLRRGSPSSPTSRSSAGSSGAGWACAWREAYEITMAGLAATLPVLRRRRGRHRPQLLGDSEGRDAATAGRLPAWSPSWSSSTRVYLLALVIINGILLRTGVLHGPARRA